MANHTPKTNDPKKVKFLPFHPYEPTNNRNKTGRPHSNTPLTSNAVNKPVISTNIKGTFFDPNKCLTSLPEQSSDETNWKIKWIEQFDGLKREYRAKEEELKKVIAHKNAEIGKQKLKWSKLLEQKADEIKDYEMKCIAKDDVLRGKVADFRRIRKESKAKDEEINRCAAEVQQFKVKCSELDGTIKEHLDVINRLKWQLKASDERAERSEAEARQYKISYNELHGTIREHAADIKSLKWQLNASNEMVDQKEAQVQHYKSECQKLTEIAEKRLVEISSELETEDEVGAQNQNTNQGHKLNCSSTKSPTNYQCLICLKYFNKKSSLDDHLTETLCAGEKKLDFNCEICEKMFTHRGLVRHLTQFLNNKHAARGQHAKFDTEYHQKLLNSHKSKKK